MQSPTQEDSTERRAIAGLLPYLWEFRGRVLLALLFLILAKVANILLPVALKFIVDGLDPSINDVVTLPLALLLAYGLLRFASVMFGELRDLVFGRVTERAMRRAALAVFRHLHQLDLAFHLTRRTGGLSRDIERGLAGISFLLRFMLFNIIPTLIEIGLIATILLVNYSPWFAVITLGSVALYIGFSVVVTEWRTAYVRRSNELDSQANTRAIDSLLNYETVKYFGNEAYEAEQYDRGLAGWEQALRLSRRSLAGLNAGQAVIIASAITLMMVMAAQQVVEGRMSLGDLVLVNAYMLQLFIPLNFLGFVYREIKRALADMGRMFRLLEVRSGVVDLPGASELQIGTADVRFRDVQFGYHPDRQILNGISFHVPAGRKIAIVGPSGAGKSTIARLLFRFYDVDAGAIEISGQDARSVTQASLRSAIGVVPQDAVLFNDSIEYNIRYGRPDASDDEVREAARLAHLTAFIDQLPQGFDTRVGERGLKLSGGEKQRVAIARAILKDPPIMLFDEATSSLDSATEREILEALNEIARNRTTLVIAHRLSTVVDADEIIVLDAGQIRERGRHAELLTAGGLYARLWEMQQRELNSSDAPDSAAQPATGSGALSSDPDLV